MTKATIWRAVQFIPLATLVAVYGGMAVLGLLGEEEFFNILAVLGQSPEITSLLVHSVFVLDGTVVLLLLFGNKLHTRFPWTLLFAWTALWPWVPRTLEFLGGLEVEYGDALLLTIASVLAWYIWKNKGVVLFARK